MDSEISPSASQAPPKKRRRWAFYSCAFLIILLLAAIAVPNFVKARTTYCKNACVNVLRQIDGAKEQWALENKKTAGTTVTPADEEAVCRYIKGGLPKCPASGFITFNPVDAPPVCTIAGHSI